MRAGDRYTAGFRSGACPLWVKAAKMIATMRRPMSASLQKRTSFSLFPPPALREGGHCGLARCLACDPRCAKASVHMQGRTGDAVLEPARPPGGVPSGPCIVARLTSFGPRTRNQSKSRDGRNRRESRNSTKEHRSKTERRNSTREHRNNRREHPSSRRRGNHVGTLAGELGGNVHK